MTALSKYVLRQHASPFLFGLALILFVLILDVILQMMDQVLSKGLGFGLAAELFVYNLAWIIALAVPMAVLVSVLMAFGRLAADNEILAVKSNGISFVRLLLPVLITAAVLTILMIIFNDRVLPDWNHQARNILANLKRRKAAVVLKQKEGVFIRDLSTHSLLIHRVDERTNRLYGITLYDSGRKGFPAALHAAEGELEIFEEGRYLRLTLHDGEFHRIDSDNPERFVVGTFDKQVVHIEDAERGFKDYRSAYRNDREMDVADMYTAVEGTRVEEARAFARMDSTLEDFLVEAQVDANEEMRERAQELKRRFDRQWRMQENRERTRKSYLVEIHKKFSIPAACLVFVLLGAPLGALVRSSGAAFSVAISLVFFLTYWMFLIAGEKLADRGFVAPMLAMWAPNLFFGGLGLALLRAVTEDRPLFGWMRRLRPLPHGSARPAP